MLLKDGNLTIRNACAGDAAQLAAWWNDGAVMAHAGFPLGLGETAENIAASLARDSDNGGRRLMIEVDGRPAGEMNYRRVDACTAKIGIKICDPSCRDRGLGKRLLRMFIGELLGPMGYRRIVLDTNLNNRRAQHVYEQLGFRRLGLRKDAWRDQLRVLQSAVDYELRPEDFISCPGPARP